MSWLLLFVAGVLEVAWSLGLKLSDGLRRPLPAVLTIAAMVASMALLARAARELPIGTAYAVWVGIGAVGAAIGGVVLFDEPVTATRTACMLMLVAAIVGLRLTTPG
jgi:quaternary ammonium compound-resistance protein SugE